jgi:hypothetical protein
MALLDLILGKPLANDEEEQQHIGPVAGIPVLGLDALSSAAYGPEAALTLLIPLGAAGLAHVGPISALIVAILLVVFFSYRQTIAAYPSGGGSYTVARENLAVNAHYRQVAVQIAVGAPLALETQEAPIVVVAAQSWNRLTMRGLAFGMQLSRTVRAVQVKSETSKMRDLTADWEQLVGAPARLAGQEAPELVVLTSHYRQFFTPLIDYVLKLRAAHPERDVVVVIPDLVVVHWWQRVLHNNRGTVLRTLLRLRGDGRVVVVNTPFYLRD